MKRSDMIELMWKFIQTVERDYDYYMEKHDTEELLNKMEQAGMLPPLQQCKVIPDEVRGGFKHSECKREWEEE